MPKYPASQGMIHTVGLYGGGQRWQVVTPFIATGALFPAVAGKEICDWYEGIVIPKYQDILAVDCEILGQSCEEMCSGNALPFRVNYQVGTFLGNIGGRSYSQQVSVLSAFFSSLQIADGPSTHTGKSFWGPPPESKCDQQVLDAGYSGTTVPALQVAVIGGFTGASGTTYKRGLARKPNNADDVYVVDFASARQTVFTQRRRLTPLM